MTQAGWNSARIRAAAVQPYRLPLRPGWRSARGTLDARCGALLRLDTEDGRCGWGDCAPLAESDAVAALAAWSAKLQGLELRRARDQLARASLHAAARCAVDTALEDLAAQQAGMPLARRLNAEAPLAVRCNAILGPLDQGTRGRANAALAEGYTVLKVKVGLDTVAAELALLHDLARALPAAARLRLDANGAWDADRAREFLAGAAGLPLDMIEEPLAVPCLDLLRELQDGTEIALALDESLPRLGMAAVVAAGAVRRLVLKPMLLGGLDISIEWARQARAHGMACVATTTLDSAAGTLAAAHLAAALDNGLAHGLATSAWLLRDVGAAPAIHAGTLHLDDVAGLGFRPL